LSGLPFTSCSSTLARNPRYPKLRNPEGRSLWRCPHHANSMVVPFAYDSFTLLNGILTESLRLSPSSTGLMPKAVVGTVRLFMQWSSSTDAPLNHKARLPQETHTRSKWNAHHSAITSDLLSIICGLGQACNLIDVRQPPWSRRPLWPPTTSNFDRNQTIAPVQAQQPKTKPDDAFNFWGCCEYCRT
jgi:hypothetical protein